MENAHQSRTPPKSPNGRNKIALLSLGTCVLLGIVGVEVFLETNDKATPFHLQNYALGSTNSQTEELQIELNHANQNLNQLKRQLFVRNSAPVSAFNRKLQEDFAEKERAINKLAETIQTHEVQLTHEKNKVATLESSLASLAELIEIQKSSKEHFHDALRKTVEAKEDDSLAFKESLAQANEKIDALKARIAFELAEKQSLVEALETNAKLHHETSKHLATLNDEIAIERTVQTLASQNIKDEHQESIRSQQLEVDKLKSVLESTQVKLENESSIKENINQTVLALVNKSCLLEAELTLLNEKKAELESTRTEELETLGARGAALEDELAFTIAARGFEASRTAENYAAEIAAFEKNYREICETCKDLENGYTALQRQGEEIRTKNASNLNDKSDVEQTLLFTQLESKLAQERLTIELEDISYALIAAEHQRDLMRRNLEDHLLVFNEERQENALKIAQLDRELHSERIEKQQLLSQLAEIHLVKETEAGFTADLSQEVESLQAQIDAHQAVVNEKQQAWDAATNQLKSELAALETQHNEVQSHLQNEKTRALELQEKTDLLSRAISETEEALKAANMAFQKLEQESAEKIAALNENLSNKENLSAENLQNISHHQTQIEKQNAYIAELESALKNAESELHQAASALDLYDGEISTKTASLNEHVERKEALESELNQHKEALSRSTEIQQNLKDELERALVQANALSIQITTLENALRLKEQAIAESQDLDSQTKEEQEARIVRLEHALEEAKLALDNEVRQLKEQHIQEISLAESRHSQAQEGESQLKQEAEALSVKITQLEEALKQKENVQETVKEQQARITHLQQTLEETQNSLSDNIRLIEEEHDKKVTLLQAQHLEVLAISDALSQELKQKEALESSLKHDLEKSRTESEALNHELRQKENDKNAIQETIEQHEARIALLQEQHQAAVEAVKLYESHFGELEQALDEVRESLTTTVQQLKENHSHEVALIENTALSEKQQKEQIESELRNLATSKEHLAEKYNEAIQSIELLQQELNAKEGTLQVNSEQVNHLKMEIDHVQNALISEKKQSEDLILQLETIRNQYQNAQSSLEEKAAIEEKLQNLVDALEDQADELNQLKSVKDALENELRDANDQKEEPLEII